MYKIAALILFTCNLSVSMIATPEEPIHLSEQAQMVINEIDRMLAGKSYEEKITFVWQRIQKIHNTLSTLDDHQQKKARAMIGIYSLYLRRLLKERKEQSASDQIEYCEDQNTNS